LVFVGPKDGQLRRQNFRPIWVKACADAGIPGVHFHDLRHTGGTASKGRATIKELMGRLGHSSPRAAFTSTEVVYGVTGTGVTELPEYGVSP
jgi:integrase